MGSAQCNFTIAYTSSVSTFAFLRKKQNSTTLSR